MFLMTAMLSITTFSNSDSALAPNERKIVKKAQGSFIVTPTVKNIDNNSSLIKQPLW